MLIVNLTALDDSSVVGIVGQKGNGDDCVYEMSEMLYQMLTDKKMRDIFNASLDIVYARIALENK